MPGFRTIAGVFALLLAAPLAAESVQVEQVRIAQTGDRTRVVLELNRQSEHSVFTLANPNRVVVDLANSRFTLGSTGIPAGDGVVANIRAANRDNGTARLVLDLAEAAQPKSFMLQPSGDNGFRLVIDLHSPGSQSGAPAAVSAAAASGAPAAATVLKTAPQQKGSRDIVVAIDAGHGGKDPGAHGRGGLREKDAVLQISKRLAQLVDAEPGMKAFLTRKDDRYLHLGQRMALAQSAGADLFVSIHADAYTDRRVRGSTVYILSEKGASDEAAALLAKRENDADLIGGVHLADKDETLARVLVDLSQTASISSSVDVGDLFIGELARVGKVRKPVVQKAGFKVLKSPNIPSVLVETAYISNPQDESNLRSVQYQQRLAQALHNGVRNYFYANPPAGTQMAALSHERRLAREHVIKSGDTLSGIAQRYRVSVSQIRSANSLRDNRIRVGQVLRIPPAIET